MAKMTAPAAATTMTPDSNMTAAPNSTMAAVAALSKASLSYFFMDLFSLISSLVPLWILYAVAGSIAFLFLFITFCGLCCCGAKKGGEKSRKKGGAKYERIPGNRLAKL